MQMITPPTDNLYKFISIAGLLLFVVSATFPFSKATTLALKETEVTGEYNKVMFDFKNLNEDLQEAVKQRQKVSDKNIYEYRQMNRQIRIKGYDVAEKQGLIDVLGQEIKYYNWAGIVGMIIGCFGSTVGFYLWYNKVQKYDDRILRLKCQDANESDDV